MTITGKELGPFEICVEGYNYVAHLRTVRQKGKMIGKLTTRLIGYYGSLAGALLGIIEERVRATDCATVQEYITELRTITDSVKSVRGNA